MEDGPESGRSALLGVALSAQEPFLTVRAGRGGGCSDDSGGGASRGRREVGGTPAALAGGPLVAGPGEPGETAQHRVAEQAGQGQGHRRQAAPSQQPEK